MITTRSNPWYSRGHLIYLFALPLVPALFGVLGRGDNSRALLIAGALALFVLASRVTRRGLRHQQRHSASRFATHYTHALTWAGCALVGAAVFVTQYWLAHNAFAMAASVALLGFTGAYLCYGAPTLRRVHRGANGYSPEEIAQSLRAGEIEIDAIEAAARRITHHATRLRMLRVVVKSHRVLNEIHEDPADLRRARKFFSVFLPGMRGVSESYLKAGNTAGSDDVDARFEKVLRKMERLVDHQLAHLQKADLLEHDVKREVLETQIEETWDKRQAS